MTPPPPSVCATRVSCLPCVPPSQLRAELSAERQRNRQLQQRLEAMQLAATTGAPVDASALADADVTVDVPPPSTLSSIGDFGSFGRSENSDLLVKFEAKESQWRRCVYVCACVCKHVLCVCVAVCRIVAGESLYCISCRLMTVLQRKCTAAKACAAC